MDVVATNSLIDLTTGLSVTVDLFAPEQAISCAGNTGQAISADAVCPDNSSTADDMLCTPITSSLFVDSRTFCGNICADGCTNGDFSDVQGYVLDPGLCLWKPEDFVPPTEAAPVTPTPSGGSSTTAPSSGGWWIIVSRL